MTRPGAVRLLALAGALAALGACGDGGTQLGSPPSALVPVSMAIDTVVTGESTDPPLSVRVEDALGNAIEGTPVRFIVLNGEGSVSPGVAVSGSDGIAESRFQSTGSPGDATVRADVPSAPNVSAVEFRVVAQASDSVFLGVVEGNAQRAEVGSQLAIPFTIRAETPAGNAAGGIAVAFRISAGREQSAVLTADSVLTGSDGVANTLLTLGRGAGEYVVEAFATRGVFSDTARFTATATATFEGSVVVDSVGGGKLAAAQEAVIHGRGFSPIASENEVRIEGEPAEVLEATGDRLALLVPAFAGECLPVRDVGVRVLVLGDASNGSMVPLEPREPLIDLAVGEVATLRGPDAVECLQVGEDASSREYQLAIGSVSDRAGESVGMRLTTRVPSEPAASGLATSLTPRQLDPAIEQELLRGERPDMVVRRNALEELGRRRATPAAARRATPVAAAVPTVGETLEFNFAIQSNLMATCDATDTVVTGTVRAIGEHLALVEDDAAPAAGFEADDWEELLVELDEVVAPVDTAYFGAYDDIDGNGRVIVLFTPRVNSLSPPGQGGIGGFFLPLDLAASGAGGGGLPGTGGEVCPASNEAEILYLAVADPEGTVGPAIPLDRAKRNARGLTAHELEHLINAERRILHGDGGFDAAEEVWLDEALASLAEEVAGLASIDRAVRTNLTYDQVSNTRAEIDAFNAFHINNFLNLSLYMFDPSNAPTISRVDPGGLAGLQMRGFGWFLLRWLGDQERGDERAFFRGLVTGGQEGERGVRNLEQATGRTWDDLLADFAIVIAADDTEFEELDDRLRILTWEFRDVFASLNGNVAARSLFPLPFPLRPTSLNAETRAFEFDVGSSTVRYFRLARASGMPAMSLALSTPAGTRLSDTAEPQITIVRIR